MINFSLAVSSRDIQSNSVSNGQPSHDGMGVRFILPVAFGYDAV